MSSLWRRQIVTAARPFLPHFPHAFPAFSAVPFGLAGVGTVGLTPLGQKRLSADRTGSQLRGDAFRCQRRLKLRVKRQDSLTEITAVRPCPALVQHIAGTVKRKAQAAFPVIVGAHPRDQCGFSSSRHGSAPGRPFKTSGHDGPKGGDPRSAPGTSSGTVFSFLCTPCNNGIPYKGRHCPSRGAVLPSSFVQKGCL